MLAFRETPFGDRADTYWSVLFGLLALVFLIYGLATVGVIDEAVAFEDWLWFGALTATATGAVTIHAYWRQRGLLDAFEDRKSGVLTGKSAIDGELSADTGAVPTPVVDDPEWDDGGSTPIVQDVSDEDAPSATIKVPFEIPSWMLPEEGPDVDVDESAPTRWYELETIQRVHLPFVKRRSRGEETRTADPFLVETRIETVDLTGASVSFPQKETAGVDSGRLSVARGRVERDPVVPNDATRKEAGDEGTGLTATDAFLDRMLGGLSGSSGTYRIEGERWPAAAGHQVYVLGEFDRGTDGRLVPRGEVTVGRGRFEDRLAEERARLDRWRRRLRPGAVLFSVGMFGVVVLAGGL